MRTCSQCNRPGHNKRTCTQKGAEQTQGYVQVIKEMGAEKRLSRAPESALDPETQEAIEWYLNLKYPWRKELGPSRILASDEEE